MSVEAISNIAPGRVEVEGLGKDVMPWEEDYSIEIAVRIVDLVRIMGEVGEHIFHVMGYSRELRNLMSRWITSLKGFKYNHQFSSYLVSYGIPRYIAEQVMNNLEDLVVSTTIILSEDRITLTDAMTYTGILRRALNIDARGNYIAGHIIGDGRLRDIASRVALLVLFTLSIYAGDRETE